MFAVVLHAVVSSEMMKFAIVLFRDHDQSERIYRPGSNVDGHVVLELSAPQHTKGVSIVLSGKAHVKWSMMNNYNDTILDNTSSQLLGNGRDSQRLAPGRHELPFSFQLPPGLPTSYYYIKGGGNRSYIHYSLTATVLRPWKGNLHVSQTICIIDIVNTNTPQLSTPLSAQNQREGSCFCCGGGLITITVETDRGGYCPGESISLTVEVENNGNRRIRGVRVTLMQLVDYHGKGRYGGRCYHESQPIKTIWGPGAGPQGEINWNDGMLSIPETTPTISNCALIRLSYTLNVQVLIVLAERLSVEIPIVIGTESFQREQPTTTVYQPPSAVSEFGSEQPGTNTFQSSSTYPSFQGHYPYGSIPVPPPFNPEFMSCPRQHNVATENYQIPNINAENACPPLNTEGDQEKKEKEFAPVSDLVTNSVQPPSYDSIFNKN